MRSLGEFVLGLDQDFRPDDQVTFRGVGYTCIKYVPRWLKKTPPEDIEHWKTTDPPLSLVQLRELITVSGQYSVRFQSAVDRAASRILLETVRASHGNPYLVQFQQIILEPFSEDAEFYLDERDASDVPGGESTVTVATKDGFSAGYNAGITRANVVDKIYRVNFIPGTTGDGIYLINISPLNPGETPTGILPPAPAIHPPLT